VGNIFFGAASAGFEQRLESRPIQDMQAFEKLPACILVGGLLLAGIFPRVLSDDADRELAGLYPQGESHLPVHAQSVNAEVIIDQEDAHQ